jgi:ribonucleoside-diphosphate reductase alpha chain
MVNVKKRNGSIESVKFDKITTRLKKLCNNLPIDVTIVAQKTISNICDNITTQELDQYSANICAEFGDYYHNLLGGKILSSNLQKNVKRIHDINYFSDYINKLDNLNHEYVKFINDNKDYINNLIDHERDYLIDYFGFKTLEQSYLMKNNNQIIETPQYLWMRLATFIHHIDKDLEAIKETYDLVSQKYFIHATPTLFNSGQNTCQLCSCFLLGTEDSLTTDKEGKFGGIFKTLSDCATISKWAGGIGVHVSNIRSKNSLIKSTLGKTSSIIPMLKLYNDTGLYVNQGGRRNGSIAIYLEPWHDDIIEFLELKLNTGPDELRTRDLFLALWIPDLFMKQVENNGEWYTMCPNECLGLTDVYGDEFENLYWKYVKEGKYRNKHEANKIWSKILTSQIETGNPYICFKDNVNKKSNQINIGIVKSSNLCVAPETKILTSKGWHSIIDLKDQKVEVWNGKEFSKTIIKQTGSNQELVKITFSNGELLECTPYHKFYINDEYNIKEPIMIEAKDLKEDMRIYKFNMPVIDDMHMATDFKYPYTHGLFCAEGTYETHGDEKIHQCNFSKCEGQDYYMQHIYQKEDPFNKINNIDKCQGIVGLVKPKISLYGKKKLLVEYIDKRADLKPCYNDKHDKLDIKLPINIADKYIVPINYIQDIKLRWLEGLCDGDGTIAKNGNNYQLQISSFKHDFLLDVKRMMNTMGIDPKIAIMHRQNTRPLSDGNGDYKMYNTQTSFRLLVTSIDLLKLISLGFNPKQLDVSGISQPNKDAKKFITVTKIEYTGRHADTYCFNEPLEHKGVFNGIMTGQCAEITEVSNEKYYAVCNLASIAVNNYLDENNIYDWEKLHYVAKVITRNLNKIIDINYYPTPETEINNKENRPIGIGIQGLGDLLYKLKIPYESEEAIVMNKKIMETIYHGAIEASIELAEIYGPYKNFNGSPMSKGIFQFDMWNIKPSMNWDILKEKVIKYGIRNSLVTALMPTASTSQILGNIESFEPMTSNIYTRKTLAGTFILVNKYLIDDLIELNIWNNDIKNEIIINRGSIQNIKIIPDNLKMIYKTIWEIKQRYLIDHAVARGPYVDQSQSMNLYMAQPSIDKLTTALFYGWKNGLKTGCYYLRSLPASQPQQFSQEIKNIEEAKLVCSRNNPEGCLMCSS